MKKSLSKLKFHPSIYFSLSLVIMLFISSLFLYTYLPKKLAIHINEYGNPDVVINKFLFLFIMPILALLIQIYRIKKIQGSIENLGRENLSVMLFPVIIDIAYLCVIMYNTNFKLSYVTISNLIIGGILIALGFIKIWNYDQKMKLDGKKNIEKYLVVMSFMYTFSGLLFVLVALTEYYFIIGIIVILMTVVSITAYFKYIKY